MLPIGDHQQLFKVVGVSHWARVSHCTCQLIDCWCSSWCLCVRIMQSWPLTVGPIRCQCSLAPTATGHHHFSLLSKSNQKWKTLITIYSDDFAVSKLIPFWWAFHFPFWLASVWLAEINGDQSIRSGSLAPLISAMNGHQQITLALNPSLMNLVLGLA